jgi:hypothetical protein
LDLIFVGFGAPTRYGSTSGIEGKINKNIIKGSTAPQ